MRKTALRFAFAFALMVLLWPLDLWRFILAFVVIALMLSEAES